MRGALANGGASALRVLRLYWYYFSWQRTMTWVTMIGVAMCLLGLAVASPRFGSGLVALGSLLVVLFPIIFAGFAYRVIIANRRFLMLPDLRTYAATALLLLALTGTAVVLVFAAEFHEVRSTAALMKLALIAFTGISALYVMACVVMTFGASYSGFWIRAAGWHRLVNVLSILGVLLLSFGLIVVLSRSRTPNAIFWCLPALAALALALRALARSRLRRIDWCAVRPLRAVRVGSKAG